MNPRGYDGICPRCGDRAKPTGQPYCKPCKVAYMRERRERLEAARVPALSSATDHNPIRECARCGALHRRKHPYCPQCMREYKRGWEEGGGTAPPGTPPPPPSGFDIRDLHRGRPLL